MKTLKFNQNKLAFELKRLGLNYAKFGKLLSCSRQRVRYFATQDVDLRLSTVARIAEALNLDPKDLLT